MLIKRDREGKRRQKLIIHFFSFKLNVRENAYEVYDVGACVCVCIYVGSSVYLCVCV